MNSQLQTWSQQFPAWIWNLGVVVFSLLLGYNECKKFVASLRSELLHLQIFAETHQRKYAAKLIEKPVSKK